MTRYRLDQLFPDELEARIAVMPMLVLPFGTVEWHSHHLPLGLDGLVAEGAGQLIADRLDAVCAPISYWAAGGVPYPYTLRLPISIIEPLLVALFEQFGEMGFKTMVAFTGHFGLEQTFVMKQAALAVMRRSPVTILPLTPYDMVSEVFAGDHAGIGETSLLWALHPHLIRLDAVPAGEALDGVLGEDPRGKASLEWGQSLLALICDRTSDAARRARVGPPVQRARYIDALAAGVRVLEQLWTQRQTRPKSAVPSLTTPAYLAYCQAMQRGDYAQAKIEAERKLSNLAE